MPGFADVPGFTNIARHPLRFVLVVLAATALASVPASRLKVNADLTDLLPDGSPAAADYRVFLERFGGLEKVFLLIRPAEEAGADEAVVDEAVVDEAALIHAASVLEEILAASPEVASVRAGFGQDDEDFFLRYVVPRAALLTGADHHDEMARRLEPEAIRQRVARLKAVLSTPSGAAEALIARSDPLGFSDTLTASMGSGSIPLDLMTSTFLAESGDATLLVLSPARAEMDPEGGRALLAELEAAYAEVRERLGAELEFHAVGGPLYAAQDELLLRQDLQRTLAGSLIGTSLILIAAFEGLLVPLAALAPLLAALVWTGAWLALAQGDITAVSIGFAAVLVGLGIDYGIHAGARFRQAYLASSSTGGALVEAARRAGPGILTSALTTAAGFTVLGLAHFRPLRELGLIVAVGIVSILVTVTLLGSAALVLVAGRLRAPGLFWRALGASVERLADVSQRRPVIVLAVAVALTVAAVWGLGDLSVDPDMSRLRPIDHPVHRAEELIVEKFGVGLDTATVVVHGRDLPEALERAGRAARLLRGSLSHDVEISSPADLLVHGEIARERARALVELPLARAADDLERELVAANLNPRAFARGLDALRRLARGEDPGEPPPEAWPDWLAESLTTDRDGTWAALSLRLPADSWPGGPPADLVARLKREIPGTAFASAVAIGGELNVLASGDLETLSLWALAAVVLVVIISFAGRLRDAVLAILPVALGSLWTLGLWSGAGGSLDLFTLAVLPIMLGIGIDDGLHVVHGARAMGAGAGRPIRGAVGEAGRALALTTLTTCVGFTSLVLSHIPSLKEGGVLIAAGVAACLLATVMVLPAIEALSLRSRR